MKKRFALKKLFTLKNVLFAVTITAILAMIAVPRYIQDSRNSAARNILWRIAMTERVTQLECPAPCPTNEYAFTDGLNETVEEAIKRIADFGFRPDPAVAFHIMPFAAIDGVTPPGFIAFAAHSSAGSAVYVYDTVSGGKDLDDIMEAGRKARENEVIGGLVITSSVAALFCYKYDSSNPAAPVTRNPNRVRFAPDPNDAYPARMLVTAAAE